MEKVLESLMALQVRFALLRNERGQGTLEYVGMIIVAAIIVVAVLDVTDTINLGEIFGAQIEKVTSRG